MKTAKRYNLMKNLLSRQNDKKIKILTGPKGSGKATILDGFISEIARLDDDANIVRISYKENGYENVNNPKKFLRYVNNRFVEGKNNFLIVEEIQFCKKFSSALFEILSSGKFDIYISSSTDIVKSEKLENVFMDNFIEYKVYPLSFKEFVNYFGTQNLQDDFKSYISIGGLPGTYPLKNDSERKNYISKLIDDELNNIIKDNNVTNEKAFMQIFSYLVYNSSYPSSFRKISEALANSNISIDHKTVSNYINYLINGQIFYIVKRYDIRKKSVISSNFKYYLSDHAALLNARNNTVLVKDRLYDAMVAIELLRRGYEVYSGVIYDDEVDFVAIKNNEKLYIQVADDISKDSIYQSEINPLRRIRDAYPKIIIASTNKKVQDDEGIKIYDIAEWMINDLQ